MKIFKQLMSFLLFSITTLSLYAQTTTFNYTGAVQTYTVPSCVNTITVNIKGAEGGTSNSSLAISGKGGRLQAILPVTSGEVLNIYVGGAGATTAGGWNGGGLPRFNGKGGGGGGGASDIRRGTLFSDRIAVASGGGGAGIVYPSGSNGGNGGGLTGNKGWHGGSYDTTYCGSGGTQTAGGVKSIYSSSSQPGSLGIGGNAGADAGGGGDGYYGGGGGHNGGGGGGSSYAIAAATGVVHTTGFQSGNGQITITPHVSTGPVTPDPITGNPSTCQGSLETYSVLPVNGATSYIWTLPSGWIGSSTANSINVTTGSTGGTISVAAANSCGTSSPSSMILTVTTALVANAGPDTSICSGSAVTLNASGGVNYSWNPSTGLSCSSCPDPIASPSITSNYELTVSNGSCTPAIDTIRISVNSLPAADAGLDVTICSGDSIRLNASGGLLYSWSPSTGLIDPNIPDPVANPASSLTYVVNVTDTNNCINSDSMVVRVTAPLIADAGPGASICSGSSVVLNAVEAFSYSWSPAAGLSCTNCPDPLASPSVTTIYELTVSNGSCTPATDTVEIRVNPLPTATAETDITICFGNAATLNAAGGISYSWNPTIGLSNPFIADPIANPATTTEYIVTVTDTNGCSETAAVKVTVEFCTGIPSTAGNMNISLFPNPANDILNVQINQALSRQLNITLTNIRGQVVFNVMEDKISGNCNKQINVSTLAKGIYYLQVKDEEFYSVSKIIIQ